MKLSKAILTLLLMFPLSATAEISYNYLEAGLIQTDIDAGFFSTDGGGFSLEASFDVSDDFFFVGNYSSSDVDFFDYNSLFIGAGFHSELGISTQLVAIIGFTNLELDAGFLGDADENGYAVSVGARGEFSEELEWDLFVDHVDVGDGDTGVRGELRYKFSPDYAVGLSASVADEISNYGIFFRWLY